MRRHIKLLASLVLALSLPVFAAGTTVQCDQGRPGKQGSWNIAFTGSGNLVQKNASTTSAPTATTTVIASNGTACTAVSGASCTNIYGGSGGVDWGGWPNLTITIRNSGANALSNVLVEWSPDGTNFFIWDSTTFATVASAGMADIAISGNSRRFLRIEARSASGTTTVVNITANQN